MSIVNKQHKANSFSMGEWVWWLGVVEDRMDPEMLGRLRVRIYGYHTELKEDIPTEHLPWATVIQPITSSFFGGVGFSPTGIIEGTTVIGFFMDGHSAQTPVVFGTMGGKPSPAQPKDDEKGFSDPNQVYSRYEDGEQDTNRMARNEKEDKTVVKWRKDEREEKIQGAFGACFKEPETPYAPEYPYNHVYESEPKPKEDVKDQDPVDNCGHIEEWDDTPGAERYFHAHKEGTFTEIHPDGTVVMKGVKDRYVIIWENDHLYVKGDLRITVDGDAHILTEGDMNVEVKGNRRVKIQGNDDLEVQGTKTVNVMGRHSDTCASQRSIKASRIDLN